MKKFCFLIVGTSLILSCEDYNDSPTNPEEVITSVIIQPDQIDADGESRAVVEVMFPINLDGDKATADIHTSSGLFRESGKDLVTIKGYLERQADNTLRRVGRATLISPDVEGEAIVTTRVAGYARTDKLIFNPSYADSITIETDKLALKRGLENTATVTVTLLRNKGRGKPSTSSYVSLALNDNDGNNRGIIQSPSNKIGADGKSKFLISRGMDNYTGRIVVVAVNEQPNRIIKDSIEVFFVD